MTYTDIATALSGILKYVADTHFSEFKDEFLSEAYIAGGSIRSMIADEEVKDYDIFLRSDKLVARIRETKGLSYISDNAVSVYMGIDQIQIITNFTAHPSDMIDEFDFTMNQNFFDPIIETIVARDELSILTKQLVINKTCRNKLGTLARISKFVARGFLVPSKTDMLMLGAAISQLSPITTIEELVSESRMFLSSSDVNKIRDWDTVVVPDLFVSTYKGSST